MLDVRRISLPKLAEKTETTWIGEMDLWDFGRYIGPRKAISSHSSFHPPKWESFPSLIHFFFIRGIVRRRGFNIEFEKDQTVKKNKSCHVCFCYFLRNAQHYDFLKKSLVKFDLFFARPCPEWPLPRTRSSLPTKLIRCEVINRLVSRAWRNAVILTSIRIDVPNFGTLTERRSKFWNWNLTNPIFDRSIRSSLLVPPPLLPVCLSSKKRAKYC